MSQDIINKNQDISYTNLDFSAIYTEIVDLAKKLSYRWDPSISDESDPGVVLLKLSALIADKMNYNIDKSALESFPLSVTQEGNARQLYEQLGYYMNWYEAAQVPINITWIGEDVDKDISYTIPKFTIVTDSESARSYAIIGTIANNQLVVSDVKLPKDGSTIQVIAMEGIPTVFSFLGETTITSQMVDENNRLYFETRYVPQNGIFIRNSGNSQSNYLDWKRVDNLYEQSYNELRYKFGYDSKAGVSYIEFPDNYAELIGSGIEIVYFVIDSEYSNIPPKTLDRFLTFVNPREDTNISLGLDNVHIENIISATGHKNVESIDDAYRNYKRTVGTFKTLITLRDYLNFILLEGEELFSNGFVTDRTNDPQLSYKVMSTLNGLDSLYTEIESDEEYISFNDTDFDKDEVYYELNNNKFIRTLDVSPDTNKTYFTKEETAKLLPFDLKFYMLQDVVAVNSKNSFNQTFDMVASKDLPSIEALIEDAAHIEHTYKDILPLGENTYVRTTDTRLAVDEETGERTKSYYAKNSYGIYEFISSVYYSIMSNEDFAYGPFSEYDDPFVAGQDYYVEEKDTEGNLLRYRLTTDTIRQQGTTYFIANGLDKKYYRYNTLYNYYYLDTSLDVGENIENLTLYQQNELTGDTDPASKGWYEISIEALSPHIAYFRAKYPLNMTITTYSVVGTDIQQDIKTNILSALYENLNSAQLEFGEKIELDYLTEIVLAADSRIKTVLFDNIEYSIEAVYYDETSKEFISIDLPTTITKPNYADNVGVLAYDVCKDIISKSILAGTTRLLDEDTRFSYHLNQDYIWDSGDNGIYSITSETTINMGDIASAIDSDSRLVKNYTLQENEVINLLRPKLTNIQSFQTGIHYEYLITSDIEENQSYKLSLGEYIVFYSSILDENNNISGYTARVYTNGAIIQPSFSIKKQALFASMSEFFRNQILPQIDGSDFFYQFSTASSYWTATILNNSSITNNLISGSNSIVIQQANSGTIVPEDGYKFYWVLNNEKKSATTGKKYYELFGRYDSENLSDKEKNSLINSYTLKSGESFYYIDKDAKNMAIYHEGTTITRNGGINSSYIPVNQEDLVSYQDIDDIPSDETFIMIEKDGEINPRENGLYEESGDNYVLTTDEKKLSGKKYYVLKMNSTVGLFERQNNTYSPGGQVTYDVFEQVDFDDELINTLNPSENHYYERVNYQGLIIEDTYYAGDEEVKISRPRYKLSDSDTILGENIYPEISTAFKINDITTYEDSITINNSTVAQYSPVFNNLYENKPDPNTAVFYDFYRKIGDNDYELVTAGINDVPVNEGWYEKIGEGSTNEDFKETSKIYSYKITNAVKSYDTSPFSEISGLSATDNTTGFYYKFADNDVIYLNRSKQVFDTDADINKITAAIDITASSNNVPLNLFNICKRIKLSDAISPIASAVVDNYWSSNISRAKPSQFYTYNFKKVDEGTGTYFFVPREDFLGQSSQIVTDQLSSLLFIGQDADVSSSQYGYYISSTNTGLMGIFNKTADYVPNEEVPYNQITVNDKNLLDLWYSAIDKLSTSYLDKVPLRIVPIYYKFKYLCKANVEDFYRFKIYVDKTFGVLDPWECSSSISDDIVNNPIDALKNMWKPMQDNCSITISENDVFTLSEGDTISVTSKQAYNNTTRYITWPTFSNTEVLLNLENYDISYTKASGEITALESVSIQDSTWRAYSNLLLNTSGENGQSVQSHQSIDFMDNSGEIIYSIPKDIQNYDSSLNLVFQLKNPVNNRSGSNIEVTTYDNLGNEIPNSAHVFSVLLGSDNISYLSTYETQITTSVTDPVAVPFMQGPGNYLIPIHGIESKSATSALRLSMISYEPLKTEVLALYKKVDTSFIKQSSSDIINSVTDTYTLSPLAHKNVQEIIPDFYYELVGDNYELTSDTTPGDKTYYTLNTYAVPSSCLGKKAGEAILSVSNGVPIQPVYDIEPEEGVLYAFQISSRILQNYGDNEADLGEEKTYYLLLDNYNEEGDIKSYLFPIVSDRLVQTYDSQDNKFKFNTRYTRENTYGFKYYNEQNNEVTEITVEGTTYDLSTLSLNANNDYHELVTTDGDVVPLFDGNIRNITFNYEHYFENETIIILDDIFKFDNNKALVAAGVFDEIKDKVSRLDSKTIFNYSYQPSVNDIIENPLEPKYFWDKNHIYNKYIIAQLDLSSDENINYRFITSR